MRPNLESLPGPEKFKCYLVSDEEIVEGFKQGSDRVRFVTRSRKTGEAFWRWSQDPVLRGPGCGE